jgi:DNA-binding CsgD family transcriptional regulator
MEASAPYESLTPREREVLQLIAEGLSTQEIAGLLHVSVKTVQTHRAHLQDKLDIHSTAQLTRYAISRGLIAVE